MNVITYLSTIRTPQDPPHLYVRTPMGPRKVLQVLQGRLGYKVIFLAADTGEAVHIDVLGTTELLDSPL